MNNQAKKWVVILDAYRYFRLRQYGPETVVTREYATVFHGLENAESHAATCREEGWPFAMVEEVCE